MSALSVTSLTHTILRGKSKYLLLCKIMDGGGDGGGAAYNPRTVEEVFRDFKGRRNGMIKALTTGNIFGFCQQLLFVLFLLLPLSLKISTFLICLFRRCSGVLPTL